MGTTFAVRPATAGEVAMMIDWAAAEGWNPGHQDAACFRVQDPGGFLVGVRDGEPVSCISVVAYDDAFAFLGLYIVRPDARGRGHGLATWRAGMAHAGSRTVGLDGVVAQQDNYRASGFVFAQRTVRYGGTVTAGVGTAGGAVAGTGVAGLDVVALADVPAAAVAAFDAACFPAPRDAFLRAWTTAPGHLARAVVRDGRLAGFAVARPCRIGHKIGPLFAAGRAEAEALFDALVATAGGGPVFLDVPEPNADAVALAEARGLAPVFETARMHTGPVRPVAADRVFGVTSLELG